MTNDFDPLNYPVRLAAIRNLSREAFEPYVLAARFSTSPNADIRTGPFSVYGVASGTSDRQPYELRLVLETNQPGRDRDARDPSAPIDHVVEVATPALGVTVATQLQELVWHTRLSNGDPNVEFPFAYNEKGEFALRTMAFIPENERKAVREFWWGWSKQYEIAAGLTEAPKTEDLDGMRSYYNYHGLAGPPQSHPQQRTRGTLFHRNTKGIA